MKSLSESLRRALRRVFSFLRRIFGVNTGCDKDVGNSAVPLTPPAFTAVPEWTDFPTENTAPGQPMEIITFRVEVGGLVSLLEGAKKVGKTYPLLVLHDEESAVDVDIWDLIDEFQQYGRLDSITIFSGTSRTVIRFGTCAARTAAVVAWANSPRTDGPLAGSKIEVPRPKKTRRGGRNRRHKMRNAANW